jgi:solute carrier family 25 phosphate transporter 3
VLLLVVTTGPTVVGYGLEGALKFGFYETFKTVFKDVTPYQFINFLLASVVAGAVASIVLVSCACIVDSDSGCDI